MREGGWGLDGSFNGARGLAPAKPSPRHHVPTRAGIRGILCTAIQHYPRSGNMTKRMVAILFWVCLSAPAMFGQNPPEGIWQGYDGEWRHVSKQLVDLAEATPEGKFSWRPACVRRGRCTCTWRV